MPRNVQINEQMRTESRIKILATASQLFSHKGFFNVRIDEIASQAGMSPGNIYWYFSSKEDLLKAILADFFETYEHRLNQVEASSGSSMDRLERLIDMQISIMDEYAIHQNVYMSILGHGGPDYMKKLGFDTIAIGMGFHRHIESILHGAIQEGFMATTDAAPLVVYYFSFFNGLLLTYGQDWRQIPRQSIQQAVLRLLGIKNQDHARG